MSRTKNPREPGAHDARQWSRIFRLLRKPIAAAVAAGPITYPDLCHQLHALTRENKLDRVSDNDIKQTLWYWSYKTNDTGELLAPPGANGSLQGRRRPRRTPPPRSLQPVPRHCRQREIHASPTSTIPTSK